ncbi:DENN domain-containing protein 1A isoform X1 [Gopherus flavomarginatus]|uniref:DENN domain-containing protein 1A isoform X1 n=2 Tax=Gopherus flavomarginatus TaxID=286002 RepID=UPI0021CC0BF7|nr:DENN domain-containing protein 1A isoform X1 [Gopherus flavomarginatus]
MGSRIKQNPETTYEVYVEVTCPGTSSIGADPEVRRKFPEDYSDQEVLQTLTKFCFPFYVDSLTVSQVGQNFTFVLTDIDSKQRFGFCRLSSGAKSCFCILSYLPWFEVFYKLLNILADYTAKGQDSQRNELLETLHKLPIPDPGTPVNLSVHSYFSVPDITELPSIPENRNLTEYFVAVDVNNMLHLYASMLYERRILICCSKLSTLTACVHGSAAMLYPMFWQHVYIPVLPPHLLDYCCAPMPYLIGIHLSLMEKVRNMALEDVVILNVDTNTLETPFDDLQNLPSDVVSALKNRLKKVSTTTGDGVARAFLKAQASFFGSYRNALKIEPEEPITFCEETFVSHRSTAMRQFLQNAIQLQLFKQFIDGRLDRLNSGEGFSDVFEEEINMGEYAGSDRLYHQWLSTVRKGSGAIINTVKTKANPAMKTVYKFAKDHAKMGIKEVKNRLKQKDIAENGCSATPEESLPRTAPSPLGEKKDPKLREDRRPITVHFGQQQRVRPPRPPPPKIQRSSRPVRPPRPHVVKRPKSNIAVEGRRTSVSSPEHLVKPMRHYTVFLSEDSSGDEFQQEEDPVSAFSENFFFSAPFEWPQPYRALKESDSADGEEVLSPEKAEEALPPDPSTPDKVTEVNLLEDIFTNLEVEKQPQSLSQAKSLEDLRTPKEEGVLQCTFDYQRMDLGESERSRIVPAIKLSHPYNKLWSMGHDDMAIPTKYSQSSPERPLTSFGTIPSVPRRPRSRDSIPMPAEKEEGNTAIQGNITIPRPQGRKTPEQGIVPPPPAPRPTKPQTPAGTADAVNAYAVRRSDLVSELMQEPFGAGNVSLDPEFRQSVTYSPHPSQLLSSSSSATEMLQPVKVSTENAGSESDYLLRLLDPLKTTSWQNMGSQQGSSRMQSSASRSSAAGFASVVSDFASPPPAPFTQPLGYPPSALPFLQPSLNPFTQTVPAALTISLVRPPGGPFTPPLGHAYCSSFMTPNSGFYQPQQPKPNISALSMPHLFGQAPTASQASSLLQQSHNPSPASSLQPARPSKIRTLPAGHSGSKIAVKQGLTLSSNDPPLVPPRPAKGVESVLLPSKPEETKDPFEDLLKKTKQEVSGTPGNVEQLRKQWETFE